MGMTQRIRSNLPLFRRLISQKSNIQTSLSPSHRSFTTTSSTPKNFNVKGRILTGATIGSVIAGGAYVSTVDEATFCIFSIAGNASGCCRSSVINISSPNTPGLRQLQERKQLKDLVKKVQAARDEMQWGDEGPPPLLVKIAPDLSRQDLEDIAAVALAAQVDGLIISNTTISRPDSVSQNPLSQEVGGLSGKPLFDLSTSVLKEMYLLTRGRIPLIGVGGVGSGEEAYKKIRDGATLVQLYTAFAYGGPALVPQMKAELAECLKRDGYKSIYDAVGADCV